LLKVVYDKKPVNYPWEDFATLRKRVEAEWKIVPKVHDPISPELKEKIKNWTH